MKNAYLVLTDLHYAVVKEHRVNYFGEVLSIIQQVLSLAEQYRSKGYNPYLIFLGDVIDSSISQSENAMRCQDLFTFIASQFSGVYSVVGNHEEHNVTDNPFWFLVSELEDKELLKLAKPLQPKSVNAIIKVPDILQDGNVKFYFNHYGIPAKVPRKVSGEKSIGLFHQNVGSNDICKMWGTFDDVEQASYVQSYDYCFFGHMHLALGKYYLNEAHTCVGEWLGTCVGTNVNEVKELPADLSVPIVLVADGEFVDVDHCTVKRIGAEDAIDFVRLEVTQASNKALAEVKSVVLRPMSEDSLYERIRLSAEDLQMGFLIDLLQQSYENLRYEYKQGLEQTITIEKSEEV